MTLHPEIAAVLAEMRDRQFRRFYIKAQDWADRIDSALSASAEPAMVVCLPLHVGAQVMHVILPEDSRMPEWGTNLYTHAPAVQAEPPASVLDWTDEQCRKFSFVAFRHAPENLPEGVSLEDIRIAAHFANTTTPEPRA